MAVSETVFKLPVCTSHLLPTLMLGHPSYGAGQEGAAILFHHVCEVPESGPVNSPAAWMPSLPFHPACTGCPRLHHVPTAHTTKAMGARGRHSKATTHSSHSNPASELLIEVSNLQPTIPSKHRRKKEAAPQIAPHSVRILECSFGKQHVVTN